MPKYLWQVSYTAQGAQGVQKDGGSVRRAAVEQLIGDAGGKLEAFYFALGDHDAYIIADLPNVQTATGISVAVGSSGAARLSTVPLVSPEEMDAAVKQPVRYRAPGAGAR